MFTVSVSGARDQTIFLERVEAFGPAAMGRKSSHTSWRPDAPGPT